MATAASLLDTETQIRINESVARDDTAVSKRPNGADQDSVDSEISVKSATSRLP